MECGLITPKTKNKPETIDDDNNNIRRDGAEVGPPSSSFFIVDNNGNGKLKIKRKWPETSRHPPAATTSYEDSRYIRFCRMSIANRWMKANLRRKKGSSTPAHVIAEAYAKANPKEPLKFKVVCVTFFSNKVYAIFSYSFFTFSWDSDHCVEDLFEKKK